MLVTHRSIGLHHFSSFEIVIAIQGAIVVACRAAQLKTIRLASSNPPTLPTPSCSEKSSFSGPRLTRPPSKQPITDNRRPLLFPFRQFLCFSVPAFHNATSATRLRPFNSFFMTHLSLHLSSLQLILCDLLFRSTYFCLKPLAFSLFSFSFFCSRPIL